MDNLHDYEVRFLNEAGALMEAVPLRAETVSVANESGTRMANEIGAANFYITSRMPVAALGK